MIAEGLTELHTITPSNLADLSGKGVKQIANVWGTKDILLQTGIGGKRVNLCGVNTINIEIKGAEHGDYMRRGNENPSDPEDEWNRTVSAFVTQIIQKSNADNALTEFLNTSRFVAHDSFRDVYVVSLDGWDLQ